MMEHAGNRPSDWVARFASHMPPCGGEHMPPCGGVLDVACGGGRNLRHFLSLGRAVTGIDRDVSGLADLAGRPDIEIIAADLENGAGWPLPPERRFAAVVVTNYLHRPLFPALMNAVAEGGLLIYETFAVGNERFGRPRSPDFLLRPGELWEAAQAHGLTVVAYEHGFRAAPTPAAAQRICAVRGDSPLLSGPAGG
jgi:SAM-dependent methyltransferase